MNIFKEYFSNINLKKFKNLKKIYIKYIKIDKKNIVEIYNIINKFILDEKKLK